MVGQLAHELDVIERTGLAEFFLICWDLMQFARSRGFPAQGRGSAADSIVAYVLGITRVDPIRHNLLFERFINEGRTTYPDVDIDFSSDRREEVIQYVYGRYGTEHTGMVCNLVTYRARSAVREVGYALGFPRPLVDRVAKALETYDSVMVRRDLEADGGFAEFFRRPGRRPRAIGRRRWGRRTPGTARPDGRTGQLNMPAADGSGGRSGVSAHGLAGAGPEEAAAARRERSAGHGLGPGDPGRWRPSDDKGGPGDSPASVAWLAGAGRRAWHSAGRPARPSGRAPARPRDADGPPGTVAGRPIDPESGMLAPPSRSVDRLGRPAPLGSAGAADAPRSGPARRTRAGLAVARLEPEHRARPPRGGSGGGPLAWERWLEFCARIDGFPRHLSIHSGGMLVTAAPLIDIAPLERATMPGRVVVQFDKRDVETLKLIKLDLLGLGHARRDRRDAPAHRARLRGLPRPRPAAGGRPGGLRDAPGGRHRRASSRWRAGPRCRRCPSRGRPSLDDLVVEVAIIRPGPIQGNAVHPYLRRQAGPGAGDLPPSEPGADPARLPRRDPLPGAGHADRDRRRGLQRRPSRTGSGGRWGRGARAGEMEKLHRRFVDGCMPSAGHDRARCRGAVPSGRRVRQLRVRQEPRGGLRPDRL